MLPIIATLPLALFAATTGDTPAATTYQVTGRISAPDALWDMVSIDASARQLYVGRVGGVMAVDLESLAVTPVFVKSIMVHGVATLGNHLAACTNAMSNSVSVFEEKSGRVIATVPTGKHPDAIIFEPKMNLIIVANKEGDDLTIIDAITFSALGRIPVGGQPEFIAADGRGLVYNNVTDKNEIVVVDVAAEKVVRKIKLSHCRGPTGLAYDAVNDLLISVCDSGVAKFIDARSSADVRTVKVGRGADAVMFDSTRGLALIPSGDDGTLSVIRVQSATAIALVQTLKTEKGARTGAVDPQTGRVYLPVATYGPPAPGEHWPTVSPGTFKILVVAPTL